MRTEPLDPLQRIFVSFEDVLNVNTHQIVVISGHLDLPTLREAIRRTVPEFELCTTGLSEDGRTLVPGHWSADEIPLYHVPLPAPPSFEDASFRRTLMRLSQWHPVRWRRQPPLQFFYLSDARGSGSALMFNCHHGIADAHSDASLLERLLQSYARLAAGATPIRLEAPPARHGHTSYEEIKRRTPGADPGRLRGTLSIVREIAKDLLVRCVGFQVRAPRRGRDEVDFVYEQLDAATARAVRGIAERAGHTINTVVMAALYRAIARSHGTPSRPLRILCPVSLRNVIDPSYRDRFQNLMVPCSLVLAPRYATTTALLDAIAEAVVRIKRGQAFTYADRIGWIAALLSVRVLKPFRPWIVRVAQGSNACYSNPGVITERLDDLGPGGQQVLQYAQFGCLFPPYDFIFYTPQFRGRLFFNLIYRTRAFADVATELLLPLKAAIADMAAEYLVVFEDVDLAPAMSVGAPA